MSETKKYTPAPWHWEFNGCAGNYGLYTTEPKSVSMGCAPLREGEEFPADMRLISCAPEMAEMLLRLLPKFTTKSNRAVYEEIEALLRKAGVIE